MRPPNPRLADNGSGRDTLTIYALDTSPITGADEEGNLIGKEEVGLTYLAIVTPSFATGIDGNGTELSITTYECMVFTPPGVDPLVYVDTRAQWNKGKTLRAMGDAVIAGPGAWAFQGSEAGPNPGATDKPYGA